MRLYAEIIEISPNPEEILSILREKFPSYFDELAKLEKEASDIEKAVERMENPPKDLLHRRESARRTVAAYREPLIKFITDYMLLTPTKIRIVKEEDG
jgi:Mg2+ and Co2+ transporter CorA